MTLGENSHTSGEELTPTPYGIKILVSYPSPLTYKRGCGDQVSHILDCSSTEFTLQITEKHYYENEDEPMDSRMGRRRSSSGLSRSSMKNVLSSLQRNLSTPADCPDKVQILEDTDETAKKFSYKSNDPDDHVTSKTTTTIRDESDDDEESVTFEDDNANSCVFCLDGGDLIHMCKCSVLAHKNCALDYIRFPGSNNSKCCQCRKPLDYKIKDEETPVKNKYILAFWAILFTYLAMMGLSIYLSFLLIPRGSLGETLHGFIAANLGILWPLIIIYIFHYWMEQNYGPRNRTGSSKSDSWFAGFSGDCSGGGDECGICILILCFVIILFVQVVAVVYIIMSLYRHYRSFALKSKKNIKFRHEKRPLNTTAYDKNKCIV